MKKSEFERSRSLEWAGIRVALTSISRIHSFPDEDAISHSWEAAARPRVGPKSLTRALKSLPLGGRRSTPAGPGRCVCGCVCARAGGRAGGRGCVCVYVCVCLRASCSGLSPTQSPRGNTPGQQLVNGQKWTTHSWPHPQQPARPPCRLMSRPGTLAAPCPSPARRRAARREDGGRLVRVVCATRTRIRVCVCVCVGVVCVCVATRPSRVRDSNPCVCVCVCV